MADLTKEDTDAVWQFMVAAAPQLAANPQALAQDGLLASVALNALQARLALVLRTGHEFVPVRKDWLEAVTALSDSASQLSQLQGVVQAACAPVRCAGTPVQTDPQAPARLSPGVDGAR